MVGPSISGRPALLGCAADDFVKLEIGPEGLPINEFLEFRDPIGGPQEVVEEEPDLGLDIVMYGVVVAPKAVLVAEPGRAGTALVGLELVLVPVVADEAAAAVPAGVTVPAAPATVVVIGAMPCESVVIIWLMDIVVVVGVVLAGFE
mmetsp:Transcript_4956/g.11821  ORF Transcript_4956/g.11821 Transcript_4956/m.11821 type:complete len:147 (-) Transcript_4956:3491-3931(-)